MSGQSWVSVGIILPAAYSCIVGVMYWEQGIIVVGHNYGFLVSGKTYSDGLMKFFEKYSIVR